MKLGLDLYKKSAMQEDDLKNQMSLYGTIAEIYKDENQTDSAIGYYNKAIAIVKKIKTRQSIIIELQIIAKHWEITNKHYIMLENH